jgi:hypothetical protein
MHPFNGVPRLAFPITSLDLAAAFIEADTALFVPL